MKIQIVSLCLVAATLAADRPHQNSNKDEFEVDQITGPTNKYKASVSDFFYNTESLLRQEENDNSRNKRLLGREDFALGVEFGKKIIRTIVGRLGNLDLSFLRFSNIFSKIDKRQLMVLESTSTVVLGRT